MNPSVTAPQDILDFARKIRDGFGPGVRLLRVEPDTGPPLGKLPPWYPSQDLRDSSEHASNPA